MAEIATIARPYAEAVFGLAAAEGKLAGWSQTLAALAGVVKNAEVAQLIGNPKLSAGQLAELMLSLAPGAAADGQVKNFVATLAGNERLTLLPAIATQFESLRAEREGFADALITSAFDLPPAELAALVATLERRFKRKVKPHVKVDRALIGGVIVQVGDEVIDSSVRGQLAAMQLALQS